MLINISIHCQTGNSSSTRINITTESLRRDVISEACQMYVNTIIPSKDPHRPKKFHMPSPSLSIPDNCIQMCVEQNDLWHQKRAPLLHTKVQHVWVKFGTHLSLANIHIAKCAYQRVVLSVYTQQLFSIKVVIYNHSHILRVASHNKRANCGMWESCLGV